MNYVFFDIECANCLHGEGKICSFGYVRTDESFKVLKKKDILIDPDAPFLLGNAKKGMGIKLAYPLFRFRWAHTFPSYYEEIQRLLSDPDNLCFGFAVFQDVSYLSYSCRRYQLEPIQFRFFDIQLMEKELHHRQNPSGLDTLVEEYHVRTYTYHRSDDDAMMTMEVMKGLVDQNHFVISELLKTYPEAFKDTATLSKELRERKEAKERKEAQHQKVETFFASLEGLKPDLGVYDQFFWKRNFFFEGKIYAEALPYLEKNKGRIYKKGGRIVRAPLDADVIVIENKNDRPSYLHMKKGAVYLDFASFQKKTEEKKKS